MSVSLQGVFAGALVGASADLEPGVHVVLGTPADGSADLAAVLAGVLRSRKGSVRVGDSDPWSSPDTRKRIASLLGSEPPSAASSVQSAVSRALALRGDRRSAGELLAEHGLRAWESTSPTRAPESVRRQIALALALAHESAVLLVLFEPFALPQVDREKVLGALRAQAERGSVVVVITASVRDASDVGGDILLLDRGRFVRRPGEPLARSLTPGRAPLVEIRSKDAKQLAALLAADPAVQGVEWDASRAPERVLVRGKDADVLSLALARIARESDCAVSSIDTILPALDEARAASVGLWRAAHDAAREAASAQRRALAEAQAAQATAPPRTFADVRAASAPPPKPDDPGATG